MFNPNNNNTDTLDDHTSDVQKRILEVARELFVQNGYTGTSIRDIAAASKTNVAMLNYYYRSKYNLFEIIFEEALEVLVNRIFNVLDSDLPFFELLESWVNSYYEVLMEYPQIPTFIINEVSLNPQSLTRRIKQRNPFDVFVMISERIESEVAKGNIKPTPPLDFLLNVLSLCIFPFLLGQVAMPIADKSKDEYKQMVDNHKKYVVEFITNALKP